MKEIEGVPEQPEVPVLEKLGPRVSQTLIEMMENGEDLAKEMNGTKDKGPKYWLGEAPTICDIGGETIQNDFIDGKAKFGPWGFMCPTCHSRNGYGLGTGKGQHYQKQPDGRWLKVGG